MKTYLVDVRELLLRLDDYLNNPEELPVLTVGTVKGIVKDCRMQIVYDLDWNDELNWKLMFRAERLDKNVL